MLLCRTGGGSGIEGTSNAFRLFIENVLFQLVGILLPFFATLKFRRAAVFLRGTR